MSVGHFRLVSQCGAARAGELITPHGKLLTPLFLPVGSRATVRTLAPEEVKALGFNAVLANTYHLYLRPGIEVIRRLGGLHRFMGWDGVILTDSGGYQVFSLAPLCRIDDEGIIFRSHIDGSTHFLSPELAIQYQQVLGADIVMVLDECSAYNDNEAKVRRAMQRTHRWAERCLRVWQDSGAALYAIVQGGMSEELRKQSAAYLAGLDFDGYAIGGLSVGEPKEVTFRLVELTASLLPEAKPRYLMGVGAPEDIVRAVGRGIDIFDCALPTRVARNGALLTASGRINIRRAAYIKMDHPVDPTCDCYTCRNFSAAYLNHLFRSEELLGLRLATIHNLRFVARLMQRIRDAILEGSFDRFAEDFLASYHPTDEKTRFEQKQRWLKARDFMKM